jgi:hypothetical protein
VRLRLPSPSDILGLPATVVDSIVAVGHALSRAEALLPGVDDVVTRAQALLDEAAPAVVRAAPALPQLIDTANRVVHQVAEVLTPARTAALGALISRLEAAFTPDRVDGAARALDAVQARPDVLPRALDAVEHLLSSKGVARLGSALDRLSEHHLDRLLDLVTDERVDRLLGLAVDGRIDRLLDRLDVLLVDERAERVLDRADGVLHDERLNRLGDRLDRLLTEDNLAQVELVLSDERPATAMRVFDRLDQGLSDNGTEALSTLLDRLPLLLTERRTADLSALVDEAPRLLRALESGELPSTVQLGRLPSDLHAVLEVLDDVHRIVCGMPGAKRARERGAAPHPRA